MGRQMGHYSGRMGHHSAKMGQHFVQMGHEMGHHFGRMGHKGAPTDTILVSVGVMVKRQASRGVCVRFSRAERPNNQARVARADPEPFCDFRRLWYTPTYKFSAQQGWRHGVRLRSLGSTNVAI
jgi:hypothetical protein